jgi:hypothetical protein
MNLPSPFPRVSIVVSQVQHDLLTRLGGLQGRSQASYVRRALDAATPALRRLLELEERYSAAEGDMDDAVRAHILRELEEDDALADQMSLFCTDDEPPLIVANDDGEPHGAERGRTPATEPSRTRDQ